jgi:hypothetical protein
MSSGRLAPYSVPLDGLAACTRQGAIATWRLLPLLLNGVERAALRDANPVGPLPSRQMRALSSQRSWTRMT